MTDGELELLLVEDNPGDVRLIQEAFGEGRLQNSLHVATELLVDREVPSQVGVEAGEDGLLVAACLLGLLEFDLRITVLAEHPLNKRRRWHKSAVPSIQRR